MNSEKLDEIKRAAMAATPGPWFMSIADAKGSEEMKSWLAECIDKTENPVECLWSVYANKEYKPKIENGLIVSVTGNGPTSKDNAYYLMMASPEVVLELVAEIRTWKTNWEVLNRENIDLRAKIARIKNET